MKSTLTFGKGGKLERESSEEKDGLTILTLKSKRVLSLLLRIF
jgi:hypothetical protein